jgi:hypothetical protein
VLAGDDGAEAEEGGVEGAFEGGGNDEVDKGRVGEGVV